MFPFVWMRQCNSCHGWETRVMTDSWTGLELCLMCLAGVINQVTMSPDEEGDNLHGLLDLEPDNTPLGVGV